MINYFKSVIFHCEHPKYEFSDGRIRYWHIYKRNCYPNGCLHKDKQSIVPALTITHEEYKNALEGFKVFHKWATTRSHKSKINFIGVVQQVAPMFEITMIEENIFYTLKGFTLVYKECLIDNTFFEDYVYVFIDKSTQEKMGFHDEDTVSGTGHFQMDERGIVTINKPGKLKTIIPGRSDNYWNAKTLSQISLRHINYLHQDKCMKCPETLACIKWESHAKCHSVQLCCPFGECRLSGNME